LERTDIFTPKSFKIAKLNTLTMQNNSLLYALFPSIFYFCVAILKALPSWSESVEYFMAAFKIINDWNMI